jgi:hypothetical protein
MALGRFGRAYLVFIFLIAGSFGALAQSDNSAPDSKASSLCADRLRAFVVEIDEKMENSHSIFPLEETVRKYFPLYGCNIEEAISIAKTSKHFDLADHSYRDFVIVFRRRIPNGWGFKVIFGLRQDTGDSFLPAALVDMTQ